jgi:hypothetical protein
MKTALVFVVVLLGMTTVPRAQTTKGKLAACTPECPASIKRKCGYVYVNVEWLKSHTPDTPLCIKTRKEKVTFCSTNREFHLTPFAACSGTPLPTDQPFERPFLDQDRDDFLQTGGLGVVEGCYVTNVKSVNAKPSDPHIIIKPGADIDQDKGCN